VGIHGGELGSTTPSCRVSKYSPHPLRNCMGLRALMELVAGLVVAAAALWVEEWVEVWEGA